MKPFSTIYFLAFVGLTIAHPVRDAYEDVEDGSPEQQNNGCGSQFVVPQTSSALHRHFTSHIHRRPEVAITSSMNSATSTVSATTSTSVPISSSTVLPSRSGSNTTSIPLSTGTPTVQNSTNSNTTSPFIQSNNSRPLRGINIGHWLVIEPWMDDGSLITGRFKGVPDQWSFDSLDSNGSVIKAHWDSWFNETDVQKLKGYGFDSLRIPIGYWAFNNDNTPYNKGAVEYMDRAIKWARNAGMKVLIDCHGSPGSQNGQMHSGRAGNVSWQQGDNPKLSTQILQQMVQRWGTLNDSDTVFAIEIVNEPTALAPNNFSVSQSWASDTYQALQQTITANNLNPNLQIITHDSFMGIKKFIPLANKLLSPINRTTFGVDQHNYQLYTDADNSLDQPGHITKACAWGSALAMTKASMPVYIGEWSALTNICVDTDGTSYPSKNGRIGSCSINPTNYWSPQLIDQVRRYVEAQLDIFEVNSNGHFMWNFKAGGGWGLYNLVKVGAFPQPIDDRRYPGQCA